MDNVIATPTVGAKISPKRALKYLREVHGIELSREDLSQVPSIVSGTKRIYVPAYLDVWARSYSQLSE